MFLQEPLFDPATFPRLQAENPVAPKKEKRERDAKRKESRGGRKARPQVIQSHSIFEQCPGVSNYRTGGPPLSSLSLSCRSQWHMSTFGLDELQVDVVLLPPGRHGARGLQSSSTSPVCRPVKKEGKNSTEDEDHLLSKLQRDDVSDS